MHYEPSWNSIIRHPTPQWFKDAKFGIYTHWGVYSVPACGPNATWYPYNMYRKGTPQYEHHVKMYGGPAKCGYKDFIPRFTGEHFDPDEWAELFKKAGAQFAGPVAEHHDGFAMWDTRYTDWNSCKMGPKRDVVGELEKSIRKQGMRFMAALHHAENWFFYPHWERDYDTADPQYAGLYGAAHNLTTAVGSDFFDQEKPAKHFLDLWKAKISELLDKYTPDMLWFDFGLKAVAEPYKLDMLADYYNRETRWGRELVVTYKAHDIPVGAGVLDIELGGFSNLAYHPWLTDTTVDTGEAWGYAQDAGYKSATVLIHDLVDNVSKNGCLLLNVGPKADGEIPEEARICLNGIGEWLRVNGESLFGTTPWVIYGEGPTQKKEGSFNEDKAARYTAMDIRFAVKDNVLYATCLGWPGEHVTIKSLNILYPGEVQQVSLLGSGQSLSWDFSDAGLRVTLPVEKPCDHAFVLKIVRGRPFSALRGTT